MKNRTIPLTTKEEIQVQTEVNMIDNIDPDQRLSQKKDIRFSDMVTESILLRSFSSNQVFHELHRLMEDMRKEGRETEQIQKRMTLIEKQLGGLMKRSLLVNESGDKSSAGTDYGAFISQLEKQKIKLEYQLSYNGIKTQRYEKRIVQLQKEIASLQKTVELTKNSILENKLYKDFVSNLKEEKRFEIRKITELQSQLRKINTTTNPRGSRMTENLNDEEAGDIWRYMVGEVQKFERDGKLNKENLDKALYGLYQLNSTFNEEITSNFEFKSRYEALSEKYSHLQEVFKHEMEELIKENPKIKGLKSLEELIALTTPQRDTQFLKISGWIGIGKLAHGTSYFSISEEQIRQQKKLLLKLGKELKLIVERYPRVLQQISKDVQNLIGNETFLNEIISIDEWSKIKEIVKVETQVIKVENVYEYTSQKDKELIFRLRVLIKSLLEEIQAIRKKHGIEITLDAGLLEFMSKNAIQGINVEEIIALYRPLPKIIEVERFVEKPVYVNGTLQHTTAVRTEKAVVAECFTEKAVEVIKEVPIFIEKVVNNPVKQYVEVSFQNEKIVEVPTIREVVTNQVVVNEKLNDVQVEKIVPLYEQKIVQIQNNKEVVIEVPKVVQIEKPVEMPGQKEYIEVEKIVEKPVYLREARQRVKEIQVLNEKIFERDRYIEIEKQIPFVINNRQTVYLDREVPRFITNTEEREVTVTEVIEKIVPYKVVEEKVVEVPVIQEKEIVREVEKQVLVEMTHFVKGDREEIIKEVEVIVEKPYRQEVLITKDLEVEKVVPLYFKQEKPVYVEMQIPYVQSEPRIINQEIVRLVPIKEQVIRQVKVEVPVPVIVEKEVVKVETVVVEKIIEKMVEVPKIVQIEKIVEKIVPVPRIVQKIVEVPRIIEKVVTVEVPCLQIVEVIREIPVIQEVQVIREVIVQKPVIEYVKEIEVVQKEKPVELVIEKEVPKEVEVQRRIPTEIIKEIPVEVFRDRIVEKIVEIHEVTVKDRQVIIPFKQEVPVEFIVQKPVTTQKLVQQIVKVPQVTTIQKPITNTITIPEIVQVKIQKPIQIQVIKQVPGPQTIKYIEIPKQIEVLRQKVIQVQNTIEVPKQVYLYMDKIIHEYHNILHPIHVPKIIEQPYIVEVNKPQHYIHYKEIPVEVQTNRNVPVRSIFDQLKEVNKEVEKTVSVELVSEKLKEIVRQTKAYIEKEVEKEIFREVVVNETRVETVQVPAETKIQQVVNTEKIVEHVPNYIEKVVERIVMLPQIVEVVKHIHSIEQLPCPGIAVNVSIEQHTKDFTSVSTQLHSSLLELYEKLKLSATRQPDLRSIVSLIETHLGKIEKWINFPKIVQIEKPVEKIVEKEKVVLVPSQDHQKEASLSYLVEKLVLELRRIRDRNRINLELDEDIQRLFFKDPKSGIISESKIEQFNETLKQRYESLGQWRQSYPFMLNAFLQDYFTLNSTLSEITKTNASLQEQIRQVQSESELQSKKVLSLSSHNKEILRKYASLLEVLRNGREKGLSDGEIETILTEFVLNKFEEDILSRRSGEEARVSQSQRVNSSVQPYVTENADDNKQKISRLISKTSKLESENMDLSSKLKSLEKQNKLLQDQLERLRLSQSGRVEGDPSNLKVIQEIKNRLINENEQKIKRLQQSQNIEITRMRATQEKEIERLKISQEKEIERIQSQKSSSANSELTSENRKLSEQLRNIQRDLEVEKRSIESLKQQHERQLQNLKKQHQLNLQKKDNNISSIESVKARISQDYEKKIKQLKEAHEKELERFKTLTQAKRQEPKDDREKDELKDKVKRIEIELQTTKKQLQLFQQQKSKLVSTAYTPSIFTSGVKQQSEIVERIQRIERNERERYSPESTKYTPVQTYQSAIERKYVSPSSVKSKQDDASSRKSSSSKRSEKSSKYKPQMTLREFMQLEQKEDKDLCSTFIMIKIIEKIEQEAKHGLLHSFSPNNIYLSNLNPKNLESLSIKFGAPIVNKNNKTDGLYLAPEILAGSRTTEKSIVFTLAVIWDQLIHGEVYFKSTKDIENQQYEFKVRDAKLNPILKNTLFEMMNKDSMKRLELNETKRRLSLQKYIASESKK